MIRRAAAACRSRPEQLPRQCAVQRLAGRLAWKTQEGVTDDAAPARRGRALTPAPLVATYCERHTSARAVPRTGKAASAKDERPGSWWGRRGRGPAACRTPISTVHAAIRQRLRQEAAAAA